MTYFWTTVTLIFITLKLCGVIAWSWWLVLLPVIIVPVAFLSIAVLIMVLSIIGYSIDNSRFGRKY